MTMLDTEKDERLEFLQSIATSARNRSKHSSKLFILSTISVIIAILCLIVQILICLLLK